MGDMRTGELMSEEEMLKRIQQNPQDAKFYKEIPSQYQDVLMSMNRKDRREWMRKNKKLL